MQDSDKLTRLMDQAACCVNMLSPSDLSEAGNLKQLLEQIDQAMSEIDAAKGPLLEQVKDSTSGAAEALEAILSREIEDSAHSIELVMQALGTMQGLIQQFSDENEQDDLDEQTQSDDEHDTGEVETEGELRTEQTEQDATADEATCEDEATVIPEDDVSLVLDFIAEAAEHIESSESGLLDLESRPEDTEVLNQIFRAFHTIKGMAGFLNLADIGSLAHSAENLLDLARKGELILVGANTDVIFESMDMLKKMIVSLRQAVEASKPVPRQKRLDQLLEKLKGAADSQSLPGSLDTAAGMEKDKELDKVLMVEAPPEIRDSPARAKTTTADDKIKVSTVRLDNLINMSGELVIAQSMLAEEVGSNLAAEHLLGRKITHQNKIVRELQELSMSMRMVPIQGVFQKMARLVRDLSRKSGRDVAFTTVGQETELDRNIVDKIADPLVHMIRNSVDHGIEPPEERKKVGKPQTGMVELRAFHQAGSIVIEIEDDGRGLNKDRILEKAVEGGIVEPGQDLSDDQIFKLIFHAGLSTAQKITSVSGRGVGMDVVSKNIEALKGKIDISSTPGAGTTFTIRLPLTLAIIEGQIIKVGAEDKYIIPINSIVRSLQPTAGQLSTVQGRGEMVIVHGELVPLVRLYKLFGVVPATEDPTQSLLVVVEEDHEKCCLLVDELLGQQQIVIKSLGDGIGNLKGVSGGTIMGDGKVSLILDISGLIELARN